jgi:hypothetical protein
MRSGGFVLFTNGPARRFNTRRGGPAAGIAAKSVSSGMQCRDQPAADGPLRLPADGAAERFGVRDTLWLEGWIEPSPTPTEHEKRIREQIRWGVLDD